MEILGELEKEIHTFTRENKVYMMNIGKKKIQPKISIQESNFHEGWHRSVILLKTKRELGANINAWSEVGQKLSEQQS